MTDAVAVARRVTKRFRGAATSALDVVDVDVRVGGMTGLVGPDGAGKTTLIRILAGLIDPDAGEALVFGGPATEADRTQLGYMPQRFGLYEDLSVRENLELYAELRELPKGERADTFARLLDFTQLAPFTDRLAGKLSGGMKQKLGLAVSASTRCRGVSCGRWSRRWQAKASASSGPRLTSTKPRNATASSC